MNAQYKYQTEGSDLTLEVLPCVKTGNYKGVVDLVTDRVPS